MSEQLSQNALARVDILAEKLGAVEAILENGYAEFAEALLLVQDNRFWHPLYKSWGSYLTYITEKHKMGTRQVYHKVAVVKELRGSVSISDMTEIGISKASVLADIHRLNGSLPEDAVEKAKAAASTKELKKSLAEALHLPEEDIGGWMDLEFGFMVNDEERREIQDALDLARRIDPPISTSLKDFQQRKEICLRLCREFLATYPEPEKELLLS